MSIRSFSVTTAVLFLLSTSVSAADEVAAGLVTHQKLVKQAQDSYRRAVERSTSQTVARLLRIAKSLEKRDAAKAEKAYLEILRLDHEHAEARAFFRKQNNLDAVLSRLVREWSPVVVVQESSEEQYVFYQSLLGVYNDGKDQVVTLSVPSGDNIFPDDLLQRAARAKGQQPETKLDVYTGLGQIAVPRDGEYVFTGATGNILLDGKPIGELKTDTPLRLPLKQGWYAIKITANKYHHGRCTIRINEAKGNRPVPIFNSLTAIKQFLTPATEADARLDISRWSPKRARSLPIQSPSADSD